MSQSAFIPFLNIKDLVTTNPIATFFMRIEGDGLEEMQIFSEDILVIDRSKETKNQDIVVVILEGVFKVKRLEKKGKKIYVKPENIKKPLVPLSLDGENRFFGVVTHIIHKAQ
jgi:DNA polymerase V